MKRMLSMVVGGVFVCLAASAVVANPPSEPQREGRGKPDGERMRGDQEGDRPAGRPGRPGGRPEEGESQRGRGGRPSGAAEGGTRGAAEGRPGQGRGMQQMDPARLAARMLETFDKDGDKKLNAEELTALLTQMRSGRGGAMRGDMSPEEMRRRRMEAMRGGEAGAEKAGDSAPERKRRSAGGRGGDIEGAEAGGDRPKRPGRGGDKK